MPAVPVDELDVRSLGVGDVAVAPLGNRHQDAEEIQPLLGEPVLEPRPRPDALVGTLRRICATCVIARVPSRSTRPRGCAACFPPQ